MLVYFSFYDVLKIPEIAAIADNPFDLLPREMDELVAPMLWRLGADIDRGGLKIQACVHRTIDLKVVTGYRYVCTERYDKEWRNNKNFSMSARINFQTDTELASDMVRASAEGMGESGFRAMAMASMGKEGTTRNTRKDESETWEEDRGTIAALQEIQKGVRGYLHPDEDVWHTNDLIESIKESNAVESLQVY